jgi:hypothetical protein
VGKNVRKGVEGLFDTIIKEIDYEVAKILEFEHLLESIRTMVLEMTKRRLSRALGPRPEVIKGSEELLYRSKQEKKGKKTKNSTASSAKLTDFM